MRRLAVLLLPLLVPVGLIMQPSASATHHVATTTSTTSTTSTTTQPAPPTTTTTIAVTDATSTDTADWACIRRWESGDGAASSDLYGFEPAAWAQYIGGYPFGAAPRAVQDAAALRLFAANGYRFSGAWNDRCTLGGGGWLR